jgi:predicted PurR-regulated permease PerM
MRTARNFTTVILQITVIVTFISIFFFVYTSRIEHDVVVSQVDNLVQSFMGDLDLVASDDQKQSLRDFFSNMKPVDMTQSDADAAKQNADLIKQTAKLIAILFAAGIFVVIVLTVYFRLNWWDLTKESIIGLAAVAFVEFAFLTFFVKNYRSLDPNAVKLHIVEILRAYSET